MQRKRSAVGVEDGPESQDISASKVERRLLGENFCVVKGIRFPAKARHAGEPDGKGGDEAAAKDEKTMTDMIRKKHLQRQSGREELVGGPKKIKSKPFVYKMQHSRSLQKLIQN